MIGVGVGVGVDAGRAATAVTPVEYNPDPGFDTPASWSVVRCLVTGSALVASGLSVPICNGSLTGVPPNGTYHCAIVVSGWAAGASVGIIFDIGATNIAVSIAGITGDGAYAADVAVAGATVAAISVRPANASTMNVTSLSITKTG